MRPFRKIVLSVLLAIGIYVLLALPWPGLREGYRGMFRAVANACFSTFGSEGKVSFRKPHDREAGRDYDAAQLMADLVRENVRYQDRIDKDGNEVTVPIVDGDTGKVLVPTGRVGYVPMIELIALVLATPVSWTRRWQALIIGMVLVNLFVLLRVALMLTYFYSQDTPLKQFYWGGFVTESIASLYEFFYVSPTCSFLIPALIWAVVAVRPADIKRIVSRDDAANDEGR